MLLFRKHFTYQQKTKLLKNKKMATYNPTPMTFEETAESQPETFYSWEARQFESIPRSNRWYIVVFVGLVLLLAYGLFTDNYLLGIIVILIGLLFYLFEKRESQDFRFAITDQGIVAHNSLYEFGSLEDFWIFYEPGGRKDLSLKSAKNMVPYIHIPLGDANPLKIRELLSEYLPEVEHEESFVDTINRFF